MRDSLLERYLASLMEAVIVTTVVIAVLYAIYHLLGWRLEIWSLAACLLFIINFNEAKRDRRRG